MKKHVMVVKYILYDLLHSLKHSGRLKFQLTLTLCIGMFFPLLCFGCFYALMLQFSTIPLVEEERVLTIKSIPISLQKQPISLQKLHIVLKMCYILSKERCKKMLHSISHRLTEWFFRHNWIEESNYTWCLYVVKKKTSSILLSSDPINLLRYFQSVFQYIYFYGNNVFFASSNGWMARSL